MDLLSGINVEVTNGDAQLEPGASVMFPGPGGCTCLGHRKWIDKEGKEER